MKAFTHLFAVVCMSLIFVAGTMSEAHAKRMGGGSSFGSKFSHNQSVSKSTPATPSKTATPAQQRNQEMKQQYASKGGMMGILGGLALGGLLGALFFGGAFEGINFMDILLFGLIAFILYKLFKSRAPRPQTAAGTPAEVPAQPDYQPAQQRGSVADSFGSAPTQPVSQQQSFTGQTLDDLRGEINREFDKPAFIEGAKTCYARLQQAWDEGDLADLRQFTTDHVFGELQDQIRQREHNSETRINALSAELLSVKQLGQSMEASVLFAAQLEENGTPTEVTEVWHFIRPSSSQQPTWFLDGIQQVAG